MKRSDAKSVNDIVHYYEEMNIRKNAKIKDLEDKIKIAIIALQEIIVMDSTTRREEIYTVAKEAITRLGEVK